MIIDPPKKLTVLFILDILKKETNGDHHISQQEIIRILERDYNMKVERKSIARNISDLIEAGYDIVYDNGYYLDSRDFEYSELRLIIDSLLFSKNIPRKQCKTLIDKLINLTDRHFNARVRHMATMPVPKTDNRQIFYTVEVLDEAITGNKMVSFYYNEYHTDKKLHRKREDKYTVSPYQIAATNGRYYLICCTENHDNIAHYRIDHIEDAAITDKKAKPMKEVKGLEHGLDLPKHMAEHIYMFSGESRRVLFRTQKTMVDQIIDWFGTELTFMNETENSVEVSVRVNENAMFFWLLQYGPFCEVLEPIDLRQRVKKAVDEMAARYAK